MRKIDGRFLGIAQGSERLFSDFENDGRMWTGKGPRVIRVPVVFKEKFREKPVVHAGMSMWDMDQKTNPRGDISVAKITVKGFEIVFRTWGDTRVARIRADWIAIGELPHDDDWELY